MTSPSSATGDAAALKYGASRGGGVDQSFLPVAASNAATMPLTPHVNTFPRWKSGVALGPAPCAAAGCPASYGAAYADRHSTRPLRRVQGGQHFVAATARKHLHHRLRRRAALRIPCRRRHSIRASGRSGHAASADGATRRAPRGCCRATACNGAWTASVPRPRLAAESSRAGCATRARSWLLVPKHRG